MYIVTVKRNFNLYLSPHTRSRKGFKTYCQCPKKNFLKWQYQSDLSRIIGFIYSYSLPRNRPQFSDQTSLIDLPKPNITHSALWGPIYVTILLNCMKSESYFAKMDLEQIFWQAAWDRKNEHQKNYLLLKFEWDKLYW